LFDGDESVLNTDVFNERTCDRVCCREKRAAEERRRKRKREEEEEREGGGREVTMTREEGRKSEEHAPGAKRVRFALPEAQDGGAVPTPVAPNPRSHKKEVIAALRRRRGTWRRRVWDWGWVGVVVLGVGVAAVATAQDLGML
jgi:hypothetical protein